MGSFCRTALLCNSGNAGVVPCRLRLQLNVTTGGLHRINNSLGDGHRRFASCNGNPGS